MKKTLIVIGATFVAVVGVKLYFDSTGASLDANEIVADRNLPAVISNEVASELDEHENALVSESDASKTVNSESNVEIVMGIEVRKDRNCTVTRHYIDVGDGTVVEAFSCVPTEPLPAGPYDHYNDVTLASMSYFDPMAAEILGKRLVEDDPEHSRELLVRSVALRPKNTNPLLWLADESYSMTARNGKPAIGQLTNNYMLNRIAEELGGSADVQTTRRLLLEAGFSAGDFSELEMQIQVDLARIRDIQIEVTGESTLPEVSL